MSATRQAVFTLANQDVGYVEQGGSDGHSGNITKFGKWYGLDGQPWCGMAVSYWFYMAGLPLPASTSKGFAYTPSGAQWFKDTNRWSTTPQVGYVVFFSWDGRRIDHVGLVTAVNSDGSIQTIEGNTSGGTSGSQNNGGGVYRRTRKSNIVGYGIPAYAADTPIPPPVNPNQENEMIRFYKIRDEAHPTQPAPSPKGDGIFVTTDSIHSKYVDAEAWAHMKNLGWWDESVVTLIPETLHNWLSS